MQTAEASITLYQNIFYICAAVAIVSLIATVLFFFLFDIPTVFALNTGRAKKKTVEKIQKMSSGGSARAVSGKPYEAPVKSPVTPAGAQEYSVISGSYAGDVRGEETMPLAQEEGTTLLNNEAETSLLRNEAETSVLRNEAETSLLSHSGKTFQLFRDNQEESPETGLLKKAPNPNWRFEVFESTIMINTDELI